MRAATFQRAIGGPHHFPTEIHPELQDGFLREGDEQQLGEIVRQDLQHRQTDEGHRKQFGRRPGAVDELVDDGEQTHAGQPGQQTGQDHQHHHASGVAEQKQEKPIQFHHGEATAVPLALTRTIHEYLLRRPILSPGEAVLVQPSRRTPSTPASASRARSLGGLPSRTPCDGIHE